MSTRDKAGAVDAWCGAAAQSPRVIPGAKSVRALRAEDIPDEARRALQQVSVWQWKHILDV